MEKSLEQFNQPGIGQKIMPERHSGAYAVERLRADALEGESYEDASAALLSLEALQAFRQKVSEFPFGSFQEVVEEATNLNRLSLSEEERSRQTEALAEALEQKAARFSPRVADLYLAILAEIKNEAYGPKFDLTSDKIAELKQEGDLDILFSGNISWEMKLNRIETRLTDYLLGARALDKREGKEMDDDVRQWRAEELKKAPTRPPERRNESKPGVDPMERLKEGERAPAIWKIEPGFDGPKYFKEQSFSEWNGKRNVWVENEYQYSDVELSPLLEKEDFKKGLVNITMNSQVNAGVWVSCPIPYTHKLHAIEAGGRNYRMQQDQNGDIVILIEGKDEVVDARVVLAAMSDKKLISEKPKTPTIPKMPAEFSEETNAKLKQIKNKSRGNILKARGLASYVRSRIAYLAPKDQAEAGKYNIAYNTHSKGFAGAVDEIKKGDCDVVNTYFAALCAKLNIPVRHCVGHSVKGRDERGSSSINSGTGHGWSEVWDEIRKEWALIDATPAGDANLEEEQKQDNSSFFNRIAGDDIEQEAIRPSDEKLEELRKKLAERKETLSYTKEERQLAEGAGVELKEARKIVKEINEAEQTRLPNGELVADALAKLFNAIVESRKSVASTYDGPVRRREGGERIENIVRHKIGIMAGEADPLSREKPAEEMREEKIIGGFDFYIIGDKSGSMQSTAEESERLWEMQRRAIYLILSSLHRFERNMERAGLKKENALSARTESISFRGDSLEEIDLDKPLTSQFSAQDKVKLWHSLTEQGVGNGDAAALSYIYEQIKKEITETEKRGVKDNRLRLVIACSDGGYMGAEGQMRALAEELHKLNAVVVGVGLTETAANVPVVMHNPPVSRGDIARDINDLPALVAKHLVLEAVKLFPEKARESAKQIIEASIAKFKNF